MTEHAEHDCQDVLSSLDVYLDRELDSASITRIEAHLKGCSPCLEAFDFEAELRRVIARRCQEKAPEEFRERILEALRACEGAPDDSQSERPGLH